MLLAAPPPPQEKLPRWEKVQPSTEIALITACQMSILIRLLLYKNDYRRCNAYFIIVVVYLIEYIKDIYCIYQESY